jgi:hypothetical protein
MGEGEGVGDGTGVGMGEGEGIGEGTGVGMGEGEGIGIGDPVGVAVGFPITIAAGETARCCCERITVLANNRQADPQKNVLPILFTVPPCLN